MTIMPDSLIREGMDPPGHVPHRALWRRNSGTASPSLRARCVLFDLDINPVAVRLN